MPFAMQSSKATSLNRTIIPLFDFGDQYMVYFSICPAFSTSLFCAGVNSRLYDTASILPCKSRSGNSTSNSNLSAAFLVLLTFPDRTPSYLLSNQFLAQLQVDLVVFRRYPHAYLELVVFYVLLIAYHLPTQH